MKPLPSTTEQIELIRSLKTDLENSPDLSDTLQHRIDIYEGVLQNLFACRLMEEAHAKEIQKGVDVISDKYMELSGIDSKSESYHFGHGEKPAWMTQGNKDERI